MFLFSGSREKIMHEARTGQGTDTALRGLNHIHGAEYLIASHGLLQSLFLIPRLLQYDVVIAQDELFIGYVVSTCARICRLQTRWIYVAMNASTLIRRHAAHPVRPFLLKRFWSSYARIVCINSEQIEDFVRLGIKRPHLVFIPFGVDAQFFQPTDTSREEALIVSVGRDTGRDYTTLFGAAERVPQNFIVVAAQKNIPHDMTVPANVTVLYERSYTEMRSLFERARLVVIPSKDTQIPEGSDCSGQTVILEALAAGKAVIATHRSWITDYLVPEEDLVVVPPHNPEALARAINSLWGDTERRKRLAESGRAKVVERYTTEHFAKALQALMDSLT